MRARVVVFVALLVVLAVLTGCRLDVAVTTEVEEDGTGVVRVQVAADGELLAQAPGALADLRLDDLRASGWEVSGPTQEADGRTIVRLERPFASPEEGAAILRSLNGPAGPLHDVGLTESENGNDKAVQLTAVGRLDGGIEAFADSALVQTAGGVPFAAEVGAGGVPLEQGLTLRFSVSLPGEVTAGAGATAEGGTATWTVPLGAGQVTAIEARGTWSEPDPGTFRTIARVAIAALAVYVVAVAAVFALRRSRSTTRR